LIKHNLVPKHEIMTPEEAQSILGKYDVAIEQMPKIFMDDPAIKDLKPKVGDMIRIYRESDHVGRSLYYRVVIE
jgi:DNA-directed RNA polymerase subunit H